MSRPDWDETFLSIAAIMSQRGTCPRLKTGVVVASNDNQVLATGYNGAPRGLPHCEDAGCLIVNDHCVRAVHAEQNAIVQAARVGTSLLGSTAYITHLSCVLCTKLLIQVGVIKVVVLKPYGPREETDITYDMYRQSGILVSTCWE